MLRQAVQEWRVAPVGSAVEALVERPEELAPEALENEDDDVLAVAHCRRVERRGVYRRVDAGQLLGLVVLHLRVALLADGPDEAERCVEDDSALLRADRVGRRIAHGDRPRAVAESAPDACDAQPTDKSQVDNRDDGVRGRLEGCRSRAELEREPNQKCHEENEDERHRPVVQWETQQKGAYAFVVLEYVDDVERRAAQRELVVDEVAAVPQNPYGVEDDEKAVGNAPAGVAELLAEKKDVDDEIDQVEVDQSAQVEAQTAVHQPRETTDADVRKERCVERVEQKPEQLIDNEHEADTPERQQKFVDTYPIPFFHGDDVTILFP